MKKISLNGIGANKEVLVQSIINAMEVVIGEHNLDLLNRYPSDLYVHDRAALEEYAVDGMKIAWLVGHSHTHLVPLGLHKGANDGVEYLTNLANDDRFYLIKVKQGSFTMSEVNRDMFAALKFTPVLYSREGSAEAFWLKYGKERVGYIALKQVGTMNEPKVHATITPVAGSSAKDRSALQKWCQQSIVELARSLFVQQEVEWADPVRIAHAA